MNKSSNIFRLKSRKTSGRAKQHRVDRYQRRSITFVEFPAQNEAERAEIHRIVDEVFSTGHFVDGAAR